MNKNSIRNGFLATRLYPLDPNRVDYSKCLEIDVIGSDDDTNGDNTNGEDDDSSPTEDSSNRYSVCLAVMEEAEK